MAWCLRKVKSSQSLNFISKPETWTEVRIDRVTSSFHRNKNPRLWQSRPEVPRFGRKRRGRRREVRNSFQLLVCSTTPSTVIPLTDIPTHLCESRFARSLASLPDPESDGGFVLGDRYPVLRTRLAPKRESSSLKTGREQGSKPGVPSTEYWQLLCFQDFARKLFQPID
jgi:hypothetical protein